MAVAPFTTRLAPRGMVCTIDDLAAGAGVAMMRRGGSSADAAVAASAALAVTSQHMCGMGGDLLAVVHERDGPPAALNASGRAGSGADLMRLRADGHTEAMPFRLDIRSVPVPGCVDGWLALHARYGRLPLADVLEPAIQYADEGFPASPTLCTSVAAIAHLPGASDYTRQRMQTGVLVRRPGIARALRAVASRGRRGFYEGEFGAGLIAMGQGEYAESDLAVPQADWVEAIDVPAWGYRLWSVPPNSQGYLTLASAWMAEALDLGTPDTDRWAHLLIEASRQAGFDRRDVLHESADGGALITPDRLLPRRAAIAPEEASNLPGSYESTDTVALCAVDSERMGVSLIQSNAKGWGSGLVEPSTGIFLHNRGIGFSVEPGHPAAYGPGRRPPHTLCPTIATTEGGALELVLGTMGGDSQPQILLQLLARMLRGRESVGDAIAAGRWALRPAGPTTGFDTWNERGRVEVTIEGHAPSWDAGLARRGHTVVRLDPWDHAFGHAQAIRVHDAHLAGAADPRPLWGGAAGW